jgi:hypothetical protein
MTGETRRSLECSSLLEPDAEMPQTGQFSPDFKEPAGNRHVEPTSPTNKTTNKQNEAYEPRPCEAVLLLKGMR